MLFRDQSCTDILEIYNKVKAEDLSSTDEEEEVREVLEREVNLQDCAGHAKTDCCLTSESYSSFLCSSKV